MSILLRPKVLIKTMATFSIRIPSQKLWLWNVASTPYIKFVCTPDHPPLATLCYFMFPNSDGTWGVLIYPSRNMLGTQTTFSGGYQILHLYSSVYLWSCRLAQPCVLGPSQPNSKQAGSLRSSQANSWRAANLSLQSNAELHSNTHLSLKSCHG